MAKVDFRLIRNLWMFLAVAEELHFGRAARRLGMSQPPLTEQIKVLEHSLGLVLFKRSRRGTTLSPAGAAILPAVRRFAAQVEQFETTVREVAAGQSSVLHVGAITSAMLDVVPPLMDMLRQTIPNLTVFVREIDSVDAVPLLQSGELDLAFARLEGQPVKGIATRMLSQDRLAVALPPRHPLADLPSIPIKRLAEEHFIISSRQVSPDYFDMLTGICRAHGFSPRILHEVRSVASQIAYVSCGQGIALVPASISRVSPDNVQFRQLQESVMVVTAALAWNEERLHPPIADALLNFLDSTNRR